MKPTFLKGKFGFPKGKSKKNSGSLRWQWNYFLHRKIVEQFFEQLKETWSNKEATKKARKKEQIIFKFNNNILS